MTPTMSNNKQIFDQLIRASVCELIEQHGLWLTSSPGLEVAMDHAAAVGFSGAEIRGAIGLGMQTKTLGDLARLDGPAGEERERLLEDWLGECANQLLGRFKNKLLGHGTAVSMALPMVLRGLHMQFTPDRADGLNTYVFASAGGAICAWLDVRVNDGFLLNPSTNPELQGPPEGELLLF